MALTLPLITLLLVSSLSASPLPDVKDGKPEDQKHFIIISSSHSRVLSQVRGQHHQAVGRGGEEHRGRHHQDRQEQH